MPDEKLKRIVENLTRTIEQAPETQVREQKSWRGLKVGQRLSARYQLNDAVPEGGVLEVVRATNRGVTLLPVGGAPLEWTGENWQDHFVLHRRRRHEDRKGDASEEP